MVTPELPRLLVTQMKMLGQGAELQNPYYANILAICCICMQQMHFRSTTDYYYATQLLIPSPNPFLMHKKQSFNSNTTMGIIPLTGLIG